MGRKTIISISLIAAVACYAFLVAAQVLPMPFGNKKTPSSAEEDAQIIYENRMDAMLYGADIDLNTEMVKFRKLSSISAETIKRPEDRKFSYLVINDLDGSIILTDEEIQCINDYIQVPGAAVLYFGRKYLNAWDQPDCGPSAKVENMIEIAVEYTNEKGRIIRGNGMWTEEDGNERGDMLDEVILTQMAFMIYMNS